MQQRNSVLFTPHRIGPLIVKNRFIRSATWCNLVNQDGNPTKQLFDSYEKLAEGEVGLIISGYTYCSPAGRRRRNQISLTAPQQAAAWQYPIKKLHNLGTKFIFQLSHAGCHKFPSTRRPDELVLGPSACGENSRAMTEQEIEDTINDFVNSAKVAELTGADGIQIDAAHGNLLSAFLSPALNHRTDKWGGDDEGRFRIVYEIVKAIKKNVSKNFAITMKINGDDCIKGGVTPMLAAKYISQLPDVQMFEITCGVLNQMTTIRSKTNEQSMMRGSTPEQQKKIAKTASKADPNYPFFEGFNIEATKKIREMIGPQPVLTCVGGLRDFKMMEDIVKNHTCDFVALSRPLIRQPHLIAEFKTGNTGKSKCTSCGECSLKRPINAVECTWPKF